MAEVERRMQALEAANAASGQTLDFLQQQVDEAVGNLSDQSGENADLEVRNEALEIELDDLKTSTSELEVQISRIKAESGGVIDKLRAQVEALAGQLSLEKTAKADLVQELDLLSGKLDETRSAKEELHGDLVQARLTAAQDRKTIDDLTKRLEQSESGAAKVGKELEDAYKVIEADEEKIRMQLQDITILQSLREELLAKLAQTESERDEQTKLTDEQKKLTDEAQAQLLILNRQIAALRQQLSRLAVALDAAEAEAKQKDVRIADLGRRLNVALASKVQELARYRSEFFGRLRKVLGQRKDVRIVGDRFVFQSEVLFASGSAELGDLGKTQLAQLAETLKEISAKIPSELPWVLRVDGHTDRAPIHTSAFPSNWELSNARAVSVVHFLIERGIPPEHLAATGFGEFQPLEPGFSDEAYRRNRRIELKLTSR
jgi:chemotaxis protein MotB